MASSDWNDTISVPLCDPLYLRFKHAGAVVALRVRGTGAEFEIPPTAWRMMLGSRPTCDIVLDDPYVSGVHCALERHEDGLMVRDRGSKNGTFLNGTAVEAGLLRPGSVLTVGRTALVAIAEGGRGQRTAYEQLRGSDLRFRAAVDQAIRVAATEHSVLILGETGTGKDLVARAIHEASLRSAQPFVAVNCGAIPRDLIGSELFGHDRGAFTGAVADRDGYFVQADGGTLFLDELGELPLEQQPHLLRVLETRRVRRVGSPHERPIDVRIVAATHRIDGLGTPRSPIRLDLFHRLSTVVIALPPLRDRIGDLPELVEAMADDQVAAGGRRKIFSEGAWAAIRNYDWPGNVRELRQAVARGLAMSDEVVGPDDLFPESTLGLGGQRLDPLRARGTPSPVAPAGQLAPYERAMRDLMRDALVAHGSIRSAAEHLGMPKSSFFEKAERFGLLAGRKRRRRDTDDDDAP